VRAPPRALLLGLLAALPLRADDTARPRHNGSYVRDDVAAVAALVAEARKAAVDGNALVAVDRLQAMILTEETGLVPVREHLLYVSPRRWAAIQLLHGKPPFGPDILKAWRDTHDAAANAAIKGAVLSGDETGILELVEQFPAATAVPGALLALVDRAIQRGDTDAAEGYLLRVPEHLAEGEEALLRSDAYLRRKAFLDAHAPQGPPGWPTTGGDPSRARNGDPLAPPGKLRLLWSSPILTETPSTLAETERDLTREVSPILPFPPVCDEGHVYVHLGPAVAAYARATGKLDFLAPEMAREDDDFAREVDEILAQSPGGRAPTVADGILYFARVLCDEIRDGRGIGLEVLPGNELVAFDTATRKTIWTKELNGEGKSATRKVFFRGAPAVKGDRLYVCGAIRDIGEEGPTTKEEAHLFCLDRMSGRVLWRRFLGYGDTEAPAEFPPYSGLAPAVAKGVVVAVTGLGVAAAFDARTGDLLWLFRYDRKPARERERLAEYGRARMVQLRSGWMREPPRIAGDSVYFAPFDAEEAFACWLRGSFTQVGFEIEQWAKDRAKGHRHSLLEYLGGLRGQRIIYVGRRDPRPALTVSYQAVLSHPLDRAVGFAYGLLPFTERDDDDAGAPVPPEIYGHPAIAGDVLLVPTRRAVYRFDVGKDPEATLKNGERIAEIPSLPPYLAPEPKQAKEEDVDPEEPAFGALVSVDGYLFATTTDKIFCYGAAK
jgi:hypothetical protein